MKMNIQLIGVEITIQTSSNITRRQVCSTPMVLIEKHYHQEWSSFYEN